MITLLFTISIPFPLFVNNILLGLFLFLVLKNKNFLQLKLSSFYIYPIVLFLWMAISYAWSIDKPRTLTAIPKEVALIIVPLIFILIPKFSKEQFQKIFKYYGYSIAIIAIVFIIRALIRYLINHDSRAFFYHGDYENDFGLVPKLLNAIHVSVYSALAFFYFFQKETKSKIDNLLSFVLFLFVILLSSKNIIVVFVLLILIQVFFFSKIANKLRLRNLFIVVFALSLFLSFGKIKERFLIEFRTNTEKSISHNVTINKTSGVDNVSIIEAWTNEKFTFNDYFPGTAFRVYQIRMFTEFLDEEPIFWQGFGLNASLNKLVEKEKKYNVYTGYGSLNFHNQYIQNFAELGFIGFILLILMLFVNIKNAFQSKDFMHITFSVLMISLFLTESFLWRQRGVVFFTLFYCLFNLKNTVKTNIEN